LLADAAYPAPRPVRTRTGELIGLAGPWLTWATTFVAGPAVQPTLSQLRQAGAALGHLHSVAALRGGGRIGDGPPGLASWQRAGRVPPGRGAVRRSAAAVADHAVGGPDCSVHSGLRSRPRAVPRRTHLLPAAVAFGAAVLGSVYLELALACGVAGPAMDARLTRLQNRLAVAGEVATIAGACIRS
jgi:hypothetical protein